MSSEVDIVNSALTKLGEARITSLDDNVKAAREMNAIYEMRRDNLLRAYNWSFAMERTSLSASSDSPAWGYTYEYNLPADCLRVVQVDDVWVIPGYSNFIGGPDEEPFKIEGRTIVTDIGAPLKVRYIKKVTNTGNYDPCFVETLAYDLAHEGCEAITQSNTKKESLRNGLADQIRQAVRANAIELPPTAQPDDSWIASRF
jgi:hypothetical protein